MPSGTVQPGIFNENPAQQLMPSFRKVTVCITEWIECINLLYITGRRSTNSRISPGLIRGVVEYRRSGDNNEHYDNYVFNCDHDDDNNDNDDNYGEIYDSDDDETATSTIITTK